MQRGHLKQLFGIIQSQLKEAELTITKHCLVLKRPKTSNRSYRKRFKSLNNNYSIQIKQDIKSIRKGSISKTHKKRLQQGSIQSPLKKKSFSRIFTIHLQKQLQLKNRKHLKKRIENPPKKNFLDNYLYVMKIAKWQGYQETFKDFSWQLPPHLQKCQKKEIILKFYLTKNKQVKSSIEKWLVKNNVPLKDETKIPVFQIPKKKVFMVYPIKSVHQQRPKTSQSDRKIATISIQYFNDQSESNLPKGIEKKGKLAGRKLVISDSVQEKGKEMKKLYNPKVKQIYSKNKKRRKSIQSQRIFTQKQKSSLENSQTKELLTISSYDKGIKSKKGSKFLMKGQKLRFMHPLPNFQSKISLNLELKLQNTSGSLSQKIGSLKFIDSSDKSPIMIQPLCIQPFTQKLKISKRKRPQTTQSTNKKILKDGKKARKIKKGVIEMPVMNLLTKADFSQLAQKQRFLQKFTLNRPRRKERSLSVADSMFTCKSVTTSQRVQMHNMVFKQGSKWLKNNNEPQGIGLNPRGKAMNLKQLGEYMQLRGSQTGKVSTRKRFKAKVSTNSVITTNKQKLVKRPRKVATVKQISKKKFTTRQRRKTRR